jgi:hypothetical protein
MNTRQRSTLPLLALAGALVSLVSGCASPPPVAQKMVQPAMGSVITYHRKSSGSLGSYDGQVVWTVGPSQWQGQPAVAVGAPQAGITLHEPIGFGMVALLSASGQPLVSFVPPMDYQWPLEVGKTWSSEHVMTNHANGRQTKLRVDYHVDGWGDVTVPAGTFKAYKLSWTTSLGESESRWVNPQQGLATIKRHVERVPTHPQGAGVLDAELLSVSAPAAR